MEVYILYYVIISAGMLLINAFVAGFNGVDIDKKDLIGSIFWPIQLSTLIGLLLRILIENKKDKNGK
jgi:hypothetical protein